MFYHHFSNRLYTGTFAKEIYVGQFGLLIFYYSRTFKAMKKLRQNRENAINFRASIQFLHSKILKFLAV